MSVSCGESDGFVARMGEPETYDATGGLLKASIYHVLV